MIKLLDLSKYSNSLVPVTSPEVFSGSASSSDFHPEGVYSEVIFGPLESKNRMDTFSYINLNATIIHPIISTIFYRLDRKIINYISTNKYFDITKKGELIEVEDGMTGLSDFIKNFSKIKFRGETADRDRLIKLIDKSYKDNNLFVNKMPIIPPFYREIYQDQSGQWTEDELNTIYTTIIRKTISVKSQSKSGGVLANLLYYGIQKSVDVHYEYIKKKIEKKSGLIRNKLMGKRVDYSGFAVITTEPKLKSGEIGVPLRMAVSLFEPFILYMFLRDGRYKPEYLLDIFEEYKPGIDLTVENIKLILKSIHNDEKITPRLYDLIKTVCEIIASKRMVIAKRDPVLLPESYQGYRPVIYDGHTIRLCPAHIEGHNADFDGDSVLSDVKLYVDNKHITKHISELKNTSLFEIIPEKETDNVSHYKPTEILYIDSINLENGETERKLVQDYSEHRNLNMYKISDPQNRFKSFHVSDDHSLVVFNADTNIYEREIIMY